MPKYKRQSYDQKKKKQKAKRRDDRIDTRWHEVVGNPSDALLAKYLADQSKRNFEKNTLSKHVSPTKIDENLLPPHSKTKCSRKRTCPFTTINDLHKQKVAKCEATKSKAIKDAHAKKTVTKAPQSNKSSKPRPPKHVSPTVKICEKLPPPPTCSRACPAPPIEAHQHSQKVAEREATTPTPATKTAGKTRQQKLQSSEKKRF
jgi:hypothetical protein